MSSKQNGFRVVLCDAFQGLLVSLSGFIYSTDFWAYTITSKGMETIPSEQCPFGWSNEGSLAKVVGGRTAVVFHCCLSAVAKYLVFLHGCSYDSVEFGCVSVVFLYL
jgi:hypothetical protein